MAIVPEQFDVLARLTRARAREELVALKRGEGYENVHPELVSEDEIGERWPEYRTIHGDELQSAHQPADT